MTILNTLKTSTCCVNENHSFYIYRADTHQVLARGLDGYEAAKTAANRIRMYVNGVQITAFSTATYPAQNYNFLFII